MFAKLFSSVSLTVIAALLTGSSVLGQTEQASPVKGKAPIRVALNADGSLSGHVFAMLDNEQAPMVAEVKLVADGKTVAAGSTDIVGNFSFADVKPGEYTMAGVSGEYVGNQVVVVSAGDEAVGEENASAYTSLALQVAYDGGCSTCGEVAYAEAAPIYSDVAAPVSSCSTCGGGFGGGGAVAGGGGGSFRRLALIGAAVAIPVAIATGDPASPAE